VPNYEYECKACEKRFELWQPVGEAAPDCPTCGSDVKKVFHPPRVIFKGSGFYVTDLRAEKEAKSAKKEGADSNKTDSGKVDAAKPESTTGSTDSTTSAPKSDSSAGTSSPTPATATSAS